MRLAEIMIQMMNTRAEEEKGERGRGVEGGGEKQNEGGGRGI